MSGPVIIDPQVQQILDAAAKHDNEVLEQYLNTFTFPECAPVDVLDIETGRSPLHMAIASCASTNGHTANGESSDATETISHEDRACDTVRLLFENGAIWNQLDKNNETPGCIAKRLGLEDLYALMVDAGVRAEMLLNRLDGYEPLDDEDVEDEDTEDTNEGSLEAEKVEEEQPDVNSSAYLSSALSFDKDKLLDEQANGVMMEWERGIMKRSAEAINDKSGLKVLNIGAGMLIFDTIVQNSENKPTSHHIIEAHPDVLANMKAQGWFEKPGVTVHSGKWQDVLPNLVMEGETFDAIYFDTFAESYTDFKDFFSEQVIGLLSQGGKWSYFNGMGADRQISYDVYQKVVEMDLFESGFDVEWHEIDVPVLDKEWEGVKRKYWDVTTYRLPVCKFMD